MTNYSPKREPIPHKVSVDAVSEIGCGCGSENIYEGRGVQAPVAKMTTSNCGSQGKH